MVIIDLGEGLGLQCWGSFQAYWSLRMPGEENKLLVNPFDTSPIPQYRHNELLQKSLISVSEKL